MSAAPEFPLQRLPRRPGVGALVLIGAALSLNLAIAAVVATGKMQLALVIAAAPVVAPLALWLAVERRQLLLVLAFAMPLSGLANGAIPGTGGTQIYAADLLVALAFGGWLISRFIAGRDDRSQPWPRTVVLAWPLALLALTVAVGAFRGHDAWGASYLGEPMRLVIYAGVAGAIAGSKPDTLYRQLVAVFYIGTIWNTIVGLYHFAAGTSQTTADVLSTGGTRALALSTAIYLSGALVLAVLNIELDTEHRHLARDVSIALLALFDIVISFGRTTFVALALLLPVMLIALRHARQSFWRLIPLLVPVVLLAAVAAAAARPSLTTNVAHRFTGHLSNDAAVIERQREYSAMLEGIGSHELFGFGFGRPVHWISVDGALRGSTGDLENSYLWVLAGGGIAALGSLILLIIAFFVDGISRLRSARGETRALVVFALALAFIFLINTLTGPIMSSPTFLLAIWICFVLPALAVPTGVRASTR
jgi:hypothetical protein